MQLSTVRAGFIYELCKAALPLGFQQSGFLDFLSRSFLEKKNQPNKKKNQKQMKELGVVLLEAFYCKRYGHLQAEYLNCILYLTVIQGTLHAFKLKALGSFH